MRLSTAVLVTLSAFVLTACGGPPKPADVDLSGSWSGSSQDVTLSLTLNEDSDGNLSGSGSMSGSTESVSVTVGSGTHSGDSFSMVLESNAYEDATYSGSISVTEGSGGTGPDHEVRLNGTLDGSGFNNYSITLTK